MSNRTHPWLRHTLSACAIWLACICPALATGSMQCEGPAYAVEIQFSLSTGRLTELVIANTNDSHIESERFSLRQRFVDYKRKLMRVTATRLAPPKVSAALRISNTTGTLTNRGAKHRLRCDWSSLG